MYESLLTLIQSIHLRLHIPARCSLPLLSASIPEFFIESGVTWAVNIVYFLFLHPVDSRERTF